MSTGHGGKRAGSGRKRLHVNDASRKRKERALAPDPYDHIPLTKGLDSAAALQAAGASGRKNRHRTIISPGAFKDMVSTLEKITDLLELSIAEMKTGTVRRTTTAASERHLRKLS